MKNSFIAFAAGSVLALATINGANAQRSKNNIASDTIKFDKSVFSGETNVTGVNTSVISAKALKDFKRSYINVSGEKWIKTKNGIAATFSSNGIANIVYYDKKGNWNASLKIYNEEKFDRSVRAIVKSKYFDYKITQVQEVETVTLGTPTYMVHLEGDNDFKIIRVSDDEMDVYEEFAK